MALQVMLRQNLKWPSRASEVSHDLVAIASYNATFKPERITIRLQNTWSSSVVRYGSICLLLLVTACDQASDQSASTTQVSNATVGTEVTRVVTQTFEIKLPHSWTIESKENPATVVGPSGERLLINSVHIAGDGSDEDRQKVRDAVLQNAEDAMREGASDPQLRISTPLKKENTPNGLFASLHCQSIDDQTFFSEFSIAASETLVFATVEGPMSASNSVQVIQTAILEIKWLP